MQYSFDIFSLVLLVILAIVGYKKGILKTVISLVGTVVSAALVFFFNGTVISLLKLEGKTWAKPAVCLAMFAVLGLLFTVIALVVSKTADKIPVLGTANRLLGAILGILLTVLILLIISSLLWCIFKYVEVGNNGFFKTVANSYTYKFLSKNIFENLLSYFSNSVKIGG